MQTFVDAGHAPEHLARVRGMVYVALGAAQLAAGFAAGGAASPVRTALVPLLVIAVGVVFAARPHANTQLHRAAPFVACAVVALGMLTAPPSIAPLGLGLLTAAVLVGGLTLTPREATALATFATACVVLWSLVSDRPVLADLLSGGATLAMAAAIAIVTSAARRDAIDRVRVARRDAEELSLKDPLTGLANRRAFDAEAARRAEDGRLGGLLMLDIDHFKLVNDEYGHLAGDEVLAEVGKRLGSALRRADLAARLGGDEFGVLVEGPLTIEGLRRVADAVRGATSAFAAETPAGLIKITTSVGGALAPAEEPSSRQVRAARALADRALYDAKQAGRDRAVIHGERNAPSARRGRRRPRSHGGINAA